jgi:hypothetical protein
MVMLRSLRIPVVISAAFISSLSFFHAPGIAQDYPACFMVTLSGQVINLDSLCRSQALRKATVCQGPFDSDGFPIALSTEVEHLTGALTRAEQMNLKRNLAAEQRDFNTLRRLDAELTNFNKNLYTDIESATATLLNQPSFSPQSRELQQKLRFLYEQAEKTTNSEEAAKLQEMAQATIAELNTDACYARIVQALEKKFPQRSFPY